MVTRHIDMDIGNKLEIAYVVRNGDDWVVLACPFCGQAHYHGYRKMEEDIGTRTSHCLGGSYILREIGETPKSVESIKIKAVRTLERSEL